MDKGRGTVAVILFLALMLALLAIFVRPKKVVSPLTNEQRPTSQEETRSGEGSLQNP
jgi:hypothetical protein